MSRCAEIYVRGKPSLAFRMAASCALSVSLALLTCGYSAAESFLTAIPSETRPSRNESRAPDRPTHATGGTNIGTSGTTVETQRPISSMKNTENIHNMDGSSGVRTLDTEKSIQNRVPPIPAGAPFSSLEPSATPPDRSSADPGYRRYIDMPGRVPGNPTTLR